MADFRPQIGFWRLNTAKRGRNYERREKRENSNDFAAERAEKQRKVVELPGLTVQRLGKVGGGGE